MTIRTWKALIVAVWLAITPAFAESPAELLERAVYAEQTTGDLEGAIRLYQQILEAPDAQRAHAAQAQLRMGACLMKLGRKAEACDAFEKTIQKFPESKDVVASAKEHLAACATKVDLVPAPWPDGEILTLELKLAGGVHIGVVLLRAEAAALDGREVWNLTVRRFINDGADNQAVSRVSVDRHTQLPFVSSFHHTLLGRIDARYSGTAVEVESNGKDGVKVQERELSPGTFDNEQAFHLTRSLPLSVGYRTEVSILPPYTCTALPLEISVDKIETVTVAAGTFECFKVDFSIGQSFWVSTAADRKIVKFDAGGVTGELTGSSVVRKNGSAVLQDAGLGFELTPPEGWDFWIVARVATKDFTPIALMDPDARFQSSAEVRRHDPKKGGVVEVARGELQGVKERFSDYALREDSWKEHVLAGLPAVSFVGDYEHAGKKVTQYRIYVLAGDLLGEFIFKTPREDFEANRATFDAIAGSLRMGTKPR